MFGHLRAFLSEPCVSVFLLIMSAGMNGNSPPITNLMYRIARFLHSFYTMVFYI